jgi:phosphoribosylanthranilate isomerase
MWVKVCGVRNQSTATALAGLPDGDRPDAVGLNFFPGSRRCIDITMARSILASLDGKIEPVGLFVNAPLRQVVSFQGDLNLPILQLHGDESPEYVAEVQQSCQGVRILRAMRVGEAGLGELEDYLGRCHVLGVALDGCLVDASVDGQFGGTGESPPWSLLATDYRAVAWPPLLLAGGLRPDNVGRAIREVSPAGVDTASGVENTDGDKDMEAVVEFVRNARAAASETEEKLDG